MSHLAYVASERRSGTSAGVLRGSRSAVVPLVLLAVSVMALALCFLVPALPVGRNTEDFIAVLDGARHIVQGLTPHRDFPLPHGPLPLYQGVIPYLLRYEATSFLLYQWIGWVLVLPALAAIAAAQPTLPRALFVIGFVALSTLVPLIVEYDNAPEISYHASYNRLTAALLFLLLVWMFSARHTGWRQALVVGYVVLLLALTKVTAFVGAGVLLAIFAVLTPPARRTLLQALAMLVAALATLQLLTGIPLAYLGNVRMMLALNKGGMTHAASSMAARSIVLIAASCAVMAAIMPRPRPGASSGTLRSRLLRLRAVGRAWRPVLLVGAALCMLILVESQNTGSIGLAAIAALLLARLPLARRAPAFGAVALVALGVAALGPWITSITFRGSNIVGRQMADMVDDPAVSQLLPRTKVPRAVAVLADDYRRIWQAGVRAELPLTVTTGWIDASERTQHAMFVARAGLVREAADAAIRAGLIGRNTDVFTAGETELFAQLLGTPAIPGLNTWHNPRSSERLSTDGLRAYLARVDLAFKAKCGLPSAQAQEVEAFGKALAIDFEKVALTPCWEAWRRRTPPSSGVRAG